MCEEELASADLDSNIMVDCSHANSANPKTNKRDYNLQPLVLKNLTSQIVDGNKSIVGAMIESNLNEGSQKILSNPDDMTYGVSVTDGCIDWETTEASILEMADKLRDVLKTRNNDKEASV